MNIQFMRRDDLAAPVYIPGLSFTVERLTWSMQGGPAGADVLVSGPAERLGLVLQLLRCGATISDESGAPAWWGFVNGVELFQEGGRGLSASLDDLYNRIAIRYRDERISPEVNLGWQWQSYWAQDNPSVLMWGKKEGIFSKVPASPEEVRSLRATLLEKLKRPMIRAVSGPRSAVSQSGASQSQSGIARLRLRGWWDTLNWLYFSESRGYVGCSGGGAIQNFGNLAASTNLAGSFSVASSWTASTVWVKVGKYGAPGDNLTVYLRSDNAGLPSAYLVASAAVAGSALNGDLSWVRFDFMTPYGLAASTTYWLEINRGGGLDAANYYRIAVDDGLSYAGGSLLIWNGGWVTRSPDADLVFQLTGQALTTEQIKTMADPTGAGQFLKGVYVVDASGVSGRLYRDGSKRAGEEIQMLLDQGDATGRQLLASVTPERWLSVRLAPLAPAGGANLSDLVLLGTGELRTRSGGKLPGSFNPVGKWARIQGVDQLGGDRNAPGCVLISKAEWVRSPSPLPVSQGDVSPGGGRLSVAWE